MRVDDLETTLMQAETLRAGLPARTSLPSPTELLAQHRAADADVRALRSAAAADRGVRLSVRGGYDRFFGLRDDRAAVRRASR